MTYLAGRTIRPFAALALAAAVLLPLTGAAQTPDPGMIKTWNAGGSGIVKLTIAQVGPNTTAHAWGSCHPTPCNWGTRAMMIFAPNVSAHVGVVGMSTFRTNFEVTTLIATYDQSAATLTVQTLTHFTDGSGRSNYTNTVVMH